MKFLTTLCALFSFFCLAYGNTPISYVEKDLHLHTIPGTISRTMICCHGSGGNYTIAKQLKELGCIEASLVSFNFPDHDLGANIFRYDRTTFGTFEELLPALYVLKKQVLDQGLDSIDLYGFSAGGGALVNLLSVLNRSIYDEELKKMGIAEEEKKTLLQAIQNGVVILDTPLKSIEEIIDYRGSFTPLEVIAKKYRDHNFRPIDTLEFLKGLSLDVIVHFQEYDEVLSNRDDALYIERLRQANSEGTTSVVIDDDGGHGAPHFSLWQFYSEKLKRIPSMNYTKQKQSKKFIIGHSIRTSNEEGGVIAHWEEFRQINLAEMIPNRIGDDLFSVYTQYEEDETKPFTHIIGYEVSDLNDIPEGFCGIEIESGPYALFTAKGPFPESMMHAWQAIWSPEVKQKRKYTADFEIYTKDFNPEKEPEVKIYIAIKE